MAEEWRTISEAPKYEVNRKGQVRNKRTGKVKSLIRGHGNYTLSVGKYFHIHRQPATLVAEAFGDG